MRAILLPRSALFVLIASAFGSRAEAAGFYIPEQDARATGRAGAATAKPANGSAIFFNPAGIATLTGLQVEAGFSLVTPYAWFDAAAGGRTHMVTNVNFVPYGYATYRISPLLSAGIGVHAPFGLTIEWPENSPGRAIARRLELRTLFITPSLGLDLDCWVPGLSFGAGLDMVPGSVRLDRDVPFGTDVGTAALAGTAFGWGARVGLLYRPPAVSGLGLGFAYRSPVRLNFSGNANFGAAPEYRSALPPDGSLQTSVTLPQSLLFGVSYDLSKALDVELDVDWMNTTAFEQLRIDLPGGQTSATPRNWRNTATIRFGAEYRITESLPVRAGIAWDQTPVPSTTLDFILPDADRIDIGIGAGYVFHPAVRGDVGALFVLPASQTTDRADPAAPPLKGTYHIWAWVIGANVGFRFDPAPAPAAGPTPAVAPAPAAGPTPAVAPTPPARSYLDSEILRSRASQLSRVVGWAQPTRTRPPTSDKSAMVPSSQDALIP